MPSTHYRQELMHVKRVDKIFRNMDLNKDARLTYDEFKEGSKQDPTIVQVRPPGHRVECTDEIGIIALRRSCIRVIMGWRRAKVCNVREARGWTDKSLCIDYS